ncbi:hypothetical protein FA95DRAFT_1602878, partial [Auriscalpium vulgare]
MPSKSSLVALFVLASSASSAVALPSRFEERANPLVSVLGKDAGEFATDVLKTGALGGAVGGITSGIVNGIKKLQGGDKQARRDFDDFLA